jgi:hypothetical protein
MLKQLEATQAMAAKIGAAFPVSELAKQLEATQAMAAKIGASPRNELLKQLEAGLLSGLKGFGEELSAPAVTRFAELLPSRSISRLVEQLSSPKLSIALGKMSAASIERLVQTAGSADAEVLTPALAKRLVEQLEPDNVDWLAGRAMGGSDRPEPAGSRISDLTPPVAAALLVIAVVGVLLLLHGVAAIALINALQDIGMAVQLVGYADSHILIVHGALILLMLAAAKGRGKKRPPRDT